MVFFSLMWWTPFPLWTTLKLGFLTVSSHQVVLSLSTSVGGRE